MTAHSLPAAAGTKSDGAAEAAESAAEAARCAAQKIAPLWPLEHFVAVNPFLGMIDGSFADAARTMAKVAGARMTMPRSFYLAAIDSGEITDEDLGAALAAAKDGAGVPQGVAALKAALRDGGNEGRPAPLPTVADVAADLTDRAWERFAVERISRWASGHFDEGQALWASPWRDLPPFDAWRAQAMIDKAPELSGLKGFRRAVGGLPATAADVIALGAERLGLSGEALEVYFHRLLMSIGGWASFARYKVWQSELREAPDGTLTGLLAVRLGWDLALLEVFSDRGLDALWAGARRRYDDLHDEQDAPALAVDCVLQAAYERAWQRKLIGQFEAGSSRDRTERPTVQAAFCIDVRSEIIRRALESVSPRIETIGFAGFFGFPIEYVPLGQERGGAQCPVLLAPKFTVCETVDGPDAEQATAVRLFRRRGGKAWKQFKLAAVSSFGFVESMGLGYAGKLVTDSLGLSRPVAHPRCDGIDHWRASRLRPQIEPAMVGGRATGFDAETRITMAETVLNAMGMTGNFARLVVLAGHGSTTVNNPHATGLDCGACGGHTGEANARVAVAILNDPAVRSGLAERGIVVPDDTVFIGALHDTTTDRIALFDEEDVPQTHAGDLANLGDWLAEAGRKARAERARLLGVSPESDTDRSVLQRSRDWSQVRPEWGLAGCAAFIAAPRARTAGLDLGGRAFLHDYDWKRDETFAVLELIMTAPMVVASWISLQYYAAAVDNRCFGAGNKVLHNVVGTLGVLEGNGGDLRTGLPWQSVHDGERLIHEPLRLNVVIEAPVEAINAVIEKHGAVRALVDNGWLDLFAMDEGGRIAARYRGGCAWEAVQTGALVAAA